MGASRDYTTGNDGSLDNYGQPWGARGSDTVTITRVRGESVIGREGGLSSLDRDHRAARRAAGLSHRVLERPTREAPAIRRGQADTTHGADQLSRGVSPVRRYGRLGSQQQISVRGRRAGATREVRLFVKLSAYAIGLLISGVCLGMWLSGVSTAQTFNIQSLTEKDSMLNNQLETLNRDLENVRSSADVARRAAEDSMGVPEQAGVVEVQENGDIAQRRAAKPETESIIDVNGAPVRPARASSNPTATAQVSGSLSSVPQGQQAGQAATQPVGSLLPRQAPYAATMRN